jgi:hypothetical protein
MVPTFVLISPRVAQNPKYAPRFARYLRATPSPIPLGDLSDAAREGRLRGARVDWVRVHPEARRADGTPLRRTSRGTVRRLLRRGRVLARDALPLARALEALSAGAESVRLGTPESLIERTATDVRGSC